MTSEFGAKFDMVCDILDRHKRSRSSLIAILQEIQEAYSYLPEDIMTYVATALGISPCAVFGVATFYSHFTLSAKGKYVIKVCDGTACHVKKSADIIEAIRDALGLKGEIGTSDDRMFTLETVACLGACGLAPVVVVGAEEVHGSLDPEKARAIVEGIRAREAEGQGTDGKSPLAAGLEAGRGAAAAKEAHDA
ncbi:MAG: NAD(P)H-dependent oxidoreductase subunit E [Deltaproteobacteria bacterium]|jgi:NADH-quinone oxidoreductase subunit E|nr:NAD(P)H-dependent oxidoreductase subunit E [Deltaproteobacteria bacterium]